MCTRGEEEGGKIVEIHPNHSICIGCFRNYSIHYQIFQMDPVKFAQELNDPFEPMKCPGRNCHFVVPFEFINTIYESEEVQNIIKAAKMNAGINDNTMLFYQTEKDEIHKLLEDEETGNVSPKKHLKKKDQPKMSEVIPDEFAHCTFNPDCKSEENLIKKIPTCTNNCKFFCCKEHMKEFGKHVLKSKPPSNWN